MGHYSSSCRSSYSNGRRLIKSAIKHYSFPFLPQLCSSIGVLRSQDREQMPAGYLYSTLRVRQGSIHTAEFPEVAQLMKGKVERVCAVKCVAIVVEGRRCTRI
jgi:hypothetical protein